MPIRVSQKQHQIQALRYSRRTGSFTGPRLGYAWTSAEDQMVLDHSIPDRALAAKIGRSVKAIQVHRVKLKKTA